MDVLDAIKERRSVRKYKPDPVPEEDLKKILDAARMAPSAGNMQPLELVVITNQDIKEKLVKAAHGQSFIAEAPVVVVVCANIPRTSKRYGKRGSELYIIQDTAASIQNIHLAAKSLGYATCWIGAYDEGVVEKIIEGPEKVRALALIPIGKPVQQPKAPKKRDLEEITYENVYGEKYY